MSDHAEKRPVTKILHLGNHYQAPQAVPEQEKDGELGTELCRELLAARAAGEQAQLLLYRITNFALLVDTFGEEFGLAVEAELLKRVQKLLRAHESAQLVRPGEFGIVARGLQSEEAVAAMARRLVAGSSGRYGSKGQQCRLQAEIGVASYPADSQEPAELLHFARFALLQPEARNRGFALFSQARLAQQKSQFWMEAEMERALDEGRFILQYQPQFSVSSGEIIGMEALVRLVTKAGEHIPPNDFIPLAEENGFILRLGRWVTREACRQLARWRSAGCELARISVNLSPRQLLDPELLDVIDAAVLDAGLTHDDLELEITEQCVLDNSSAVGAALRAIRKRGVRVAIDDFGTGYSSFSYLAWQPLNMIKMDRSFLTRVESDERIGGIVRGMLSMARELGLEVVAEGVETEGQARFLREQGCELAQGFGLARPQDANAITPLLPQLQCA
ncbi:MAG: GGDEF domain-containing phosphodiesterase [Halieaceae bacterium]